MTMAMGYEEEKHTPTILLRNNPGMIRDCWYTEEKYLCIRQIKFNKDGTEPEVKVIRLSPEEQNILHHVMEGK